ncbi:MAG TPA: hypothetical protein P5567_08675 [Kiritimatiellia bacterium]|nr:hypothetical protein [Kiritimatiellia bacterium]HRZ12516.1 hypothetical protein [Kiritimatiellia bacterium]HSA17726.1 hypothetical protein [Kiritimatiellia bacterium]
MSILSRCRAGAAFAVAFLAAGTDGAWAGPTEFLFEPNPVYAATNWEFTTDLRIRAPDRNPGAFQIVLVYEPDVLRILDVTPSPSTPFYSYFQADAASFSKGYTRIAALQTQDLSDSMDEVVLRVQWAAIGSGARTSDVSVYVEGLVDVRWRETSGAGTPLAVDVRGVDTNANTIPDAWEEGRYGAPTNAAPGSDEDGDGYTLEQEYWADTDPRDPDSLPLVGVATAGPNAAVFCEGSRLRRYHFDVQDSLVSGTWSNWFSVQPSGDGTIWLLDHDRETNRFYRLRVQLPISGAAGGGETNEHWTSDAVTDFTALQPLLYRLHPGGAYTLTALDLLSSERFEFRFNLANGSSRANTDWAGGMLWFDGTPFDASVNGIVLGLSASGTTEVKLEATDTGGRKAVVILGALSRNERNYRVPAAELLAAGGSGFDPGHIRAIAVVVDGAVAGWSRASGLVNVRTKGVPYDQKSNILLSGTAYDTNALSSFGSYYPAWVPDGGNTSEEGSNGIIVATGMPEARGFRYEYDLTADPGAFAYVAIHRGGVLLFRLPAIYTFAAKGTAGARMRVTYRDGDEHMGQVVVLLEEGFRNYSIDFSTMAPADFDRLRVKELTFVQDWTIGTPFLEDAVQIETPGLDYP